MDTASPLANATQPEAARAGMLASLASVDLVTIYTEPEPGALMAALQPDVAPAQQQ